MTGAWSRALGGQGQPNSTVTIANGVAFIGVGQSGQVFAFNASDGTPLWQSTAGLGRTYAAPMVAKGSVFVGSWDGSNSTDKGTVRAYSPGGSILPPTLSVSPTNLAFTATAGGSNPPNQTITVANSGTGIAKLHSIERCRLADSDARFWNCASGSHHQHQHFWPACRYL